MRLISLVQVILQSSFSFPRSSLLCVIFCWLYVQRNLFGFLMSGAIAFVSFSEMVSSHALNFSEQSPHRLCLFFEVLPAWSIFWHIESEAKTSCLLLNQNYYTYVKSIIIPGSCAMIQPSPPNFKITEKQIKTV